MVRSELLQKMCNLHPNIVRRDMEKILEIIFLEITRALCEGKNIGSKYFFALRLMYITFSFLSRPTAQRRQRSNLRT